MSKKQKKTYKSCDNFHLHETEAEYSIEGDNYETNKIKGIKMSVSIIIKTKRYEKKKNGNYIIINFFIF